VVLLDSEARVSLLIDGETKWWNQTLVRAIFRREEADLICSLPICPRPQSERLIWAGSKNGEFSVRSAYHFAKGMAESNEGSCSNVENCSQAWRKIWNLRGTRVVKTFLWKSCNNILATKSNLYRKGISQDPLCPICGLELEMVGHCLWSCSSAQDLWWEGPSVIQKSACVEDTFMNIFLNLHDKLSEEDLQLVAFTARLIWLRRNEVVFGGELTAPPIIFKRAKDQLEAYTSAEVASHELVVTTQILLDYL
jgi:hypothetical protein